MNFSDGDRGQHRHHHRPAGRPQQFHRRRQLYAGSSPGSGTWTGTAAEFNALSFTAGAPGTSTLTITAADGNATSTVSDPLFINAFVPAFAGGGLAGEIVTNFTGPITASSAALTPDATFTATDINYGGNGSGALNTIAQFLDADGQTDGNTVSNSSVATGYDAGQVYNFYLNMNGYILLTGGTTYTFATTSDDGSILSIDGNEIVDNNFSQGPDPKNRHLYRRYDRLLRDRYSIFPRRRRRVTGCAIFDRRRPNLHRPDLARLARRCRP